MDFIAFAFIAFTMARPICAKVASDVAYCKTFKRSLSQMDTDTMMMAVMAHRVVDRWCFGGRFECLVCVCEGGHVRV